MDDHTEKDLANGAVQVASSKVFERDEVQNFMIFNHLANYESNNMSYSESAFDIIWNDNENFCDTNFEHGWTICNMCNMILKNEEFKLHLEIHKIGESVSIVQQIASPQEIECGSHQNLPNILANCDRNNEIFYENIFPNENRDGSKNCRIRNLTVANEEFELDSEHHNHDNLLNYVETVLSGTSSFDIDDSSLDPLLVINVT